MQEETEESDVNEIPPDIIFPMELNSYLRDKLNTAELESWQLKQYIKLQEDEISDLRAKESKSNMREPEETRDYSTHIMASKLVDVNRKNREMTAKMESMKSKMQLLMDANEKFKEKVQELEKNSERGDNQSRDFSVSSSQRTDEEIVTSTQELSLANSKMMQYRLQCQQLRIDLRTAQRALAQEVGDGATVKNVLQMVNNTAVPWRGRQQQIIALTQKLAEAQVKILEYKQNTTQHQVEPHVMGAGGEGGGLEHDVQTGENNGGELNKTFLGFSPGMTQFQRRMSGLQQQEKKKFETLERVSQECEAAKSELKSIQLEAKASKARTQTLEGQVRTYRLQVEDLQLKLNQKQAELDSNWNELVTMKQEFMALKDREKNLRETSSTEIRESQQALTRERAVVVRLQDVIAKKQESVEKLESEVVRLQRNLDSCCSGTKNSPVGRESESRIATLEDQLNQAAKAMEEFEKERQRLLKVMSGAVDRAEEERLSHSNTHRHLIKAFEVLKQSDSCIEQCLECAQITSKPVLQEVEAIRSLMRELKTGSLFSLENVQLDDVRKLKSQVSIMTKEITILKHHLNKSAEERGMDLQQFSILADKMRSELYCVLQKAVGSFRVSNS